MGGGASPWGQQRCAELCPLAKWPCLSPCDAALVLLLGRLSAVTFNCRQYLRLQQHLADLIRRAQRLGSELDQRPRQDYHEMKGEAGSEQGPQELDASEVADFRLACQISASLGGAESFLLICSPGSSCVRGRRRFRVCQ